MKLDTDKCHLLVSGTKSEDRWTKMGDDKIWESNEVKLLVVKIDNKFKSDGHTANICFKIIQKVVY